MRPTVAVALLLASAIAPARADDLVERFAAHESTWTAEVSPDGRRVALGCTRDGTRAACIYELDAPDKTRVFRTQGDQRLNAISWVGPESIALLVRTTETARDVTSSLRTFSADRTLAINLRTDERAYLLMNTSAGAWTNLDDIASLRSSPPNTVSMRAQYWTGKTARDTRIERTQEGWRHALYVADLGSGSGRVEYVGGPDTVDIVTGPDGRAIARVDWDRKTERETISRVTGNSPVVIYQREGAGDNRTAVLGWVEAGRQLVVGSDDESGRYSVSYMDLNTGARTAVPLDLGDAVVTGTRTAANSDEVVGITTAGGAGTKFLDPALARARASMEKALAGKRVRLESWSEDRSVIAAYVSGGGATGSYYLYDRNQKSISPLGDERPEAGDMAVAETVAMEYQARDGLTIEAFLTLPPGKTSKDGPFPLILMPHGGPQANDDASFDWWAGYFAHRGYAVLKPNFRGSTGYGRAFIEKGFGEFGAGMIDDIIDGGKEMVKRGIADPARIAAMGASYGGYASLMVALRDPGLVKCVVSVNGVTDPTSLLGEIIKNHGDDSPYIRFWEDYMGSRFRDEAELVAASPLRNAKAMPVPVLLIHGSADTTVAFTQSESLERNLKGQGKSVRLVTIPGDDHYLNTTAVRRTLLTEIDAFLATCIGKR